MEKRIGVIGLGRCGMPVAENFVKAGYRVYGYARRPEVIAEFKNLGGQHVGSPSEVAQNAGTIIVIVLNDEQVMDVVAGPNGILKSAAPESTVICMSTINRENLEWVNQKCTEKKVKLVDCPFTGGPARITLGTLTLIVAAPADLLEEVKPVLDIVGNITLVGDTPGMGQAVKHCNQLLVTAIHAATMELILLAEKTGVDPRLVCDVVGSGIGGNDYFRLLSKAVLNNENSPGGMGQLWKDVNICLTSARSHNLPLLVTIATAQYFNMAVAQGMATEDSARMMDVLKRMIE